MRILAIVLICVLSGLGLEGCAGSRYQANVFSTHPDEPYTLAAGDRLRVIVYGQDSLSNSYSVDGSGHIFMPLIGLVDANGLTVTELARVIENKLRNGYLRQPRVSVEVEAYRPFFVLGEVTTAGQYPYINGMTVQTAIAVAGGFTPRANRSTADLTRIVNGTPVTASVPLTMPVHPGDTINIHERLF